MTEPMGRWGGFVSGAPRLGPGVAAGSDGTRGIARFLLYAALGLATGLVVTAIEWLSVDKILHWVVDAPTWVRVLAPATGLIVTAIVLRLFGRTESGTSDMYVKAFHGDITIEGRHFLPKMLGALATVGGGGAVGLEGPSIYAGSSIGAFINRHRPDIFGNRSPRALLAAGAAAGVAAVFKAPATGVLFALESPYKRDVARAALIPALVASAAAYVTLAAFLGTDRLIPVGAAEVGFTDEIIGAIVLGIAAGIAARFTSTLFHESKEFVHVRWWVRLPVAAVVLVAAGLAAEALVDEPILLGPGAEATVAVVLDPKISVWIILALFALRAVATSAALGAGGVGGVFIPLVVQGLLLGRIVEVFFDAPPTGLFPVVGLAAMLGAGYRTPLAAVVFVAETTGRAEFVIPALLATAVSQSLMGEVSVSSGQLGERQGRLERRLGLPCAEIAHPAPPSVDPGESLLEVVDHLAGFDGVPVAPVVDDRYRGLLVMSDIAAAVLEHGVEATAEMVMRDVPTVEADQPARDAVTLMNQNNAAAVAVLDADGQPVGMITAASIAGLEGIG